MIRAARADDVPEIYRLMRDLASYEKSLPKVTATADDLRRSLFGDRPAVFAHVATADDRVELVMLPLGDGLTLARKK